MKKIIKLLFSILGISLSSLALTICIVMVLQQTLPGFLENMLLGANLSSYPFTFQTLMWYPFSVGIIVLIMRIKKLSGQYKVLNHKSLQIDFSRIDNREDLEKLINVLGSFRRNQSVFCFLLKSGLRTILDGSRYSDVKEEIVSKADLVHIQIDSTYAKIKYLSWLLPTLGFMGTVYGISLSVAGFGSMSPDDPNMLSNIASTLAIAFDTTLLSLIQSSILILVITFLENSENDFVAHLSVKTQKLCRLAIRAQQKKNKSIQKAG